jgi:hypothetical protein
MNNTLARLLIMEMVSSLTPEQLLKLIRTMDNTMLSNALKGCPQPDCIFCNAARDVIAARNEYINIH